MRQDFTDDRDQLRATIDKIVAASQGLDEDDDDPTRTLPSARTTASSTSSTPTASLSALQTAVKMLGRLNEKKSLIYFASGLRLNGVDNQAQLRATLNAAIRANVSFFPVDARGLVALAPSGRRHAGHRQAARACTPAAAAMAMANNLQRSQDTLYALAADTGGKALFDYNDLSHGNRAGAEGHVQLLHHRLLHHQHGARRQVPRIEITLKEFPSAKLDYRRGYFAGKEFGKFTAADKERQLEEALMLGDPITDLTIAMEVNYFQLNRAEYFVPVVMKIPGSELALARKGGRRAHRDRFHRRDQGRLRRHHSEHARQGGHQAERRDGRRTGEAPHPVRHRLHAAAGHLHHQVSGARQRNRPHRHLPEQVHRSRT